MKIYNLLKKDRSQDPKTKQGNMIPICVPVKIPKVDIPKSQAYYPSSLKLKPQLLKTRLTKAYILVHNQIFPSMP